MQTSFSWQRTYAVARKEFLHIVRDPATLFFALFIPVLQLMMLGYAIDTNVRNIPTVICDQANNEESRALLQRFENSTSFQVVACVRTDEELSRTIVSGKARIGIKIPHDYTRQLDARQTAQLLILVDGSDSTVASSGLNGANAIALRDNLERILGEGQALPVDARPQILFNPDTRSPNFFVPGLMVVLCQMMAVMLSANAIVREKENGTLEQLFMTPVRASELIFGKLLPYLVLTLLEFCTILLLMNIIFRVPIKGQVLTLLLLALPFVFCFLGFGLFISTRVSTRDAAFQMAMGTMLPSIFLSGYIFPLDSMPLVFRWVSRIIPTTWLIDASRGIILRGAGLRELWLHALVLWGMGLSMFVLSMVKFRKRLT
jgi:ABC-2 type transport system permease protein